MEAFSEVGHGLVVHFRVGKVELNYTAKDWGKHTN